jgi:hypothetical protein
MIGCMHEMILWCSARDWREGTIRQRQTGLCCAVLTCACLTDSHVLRACASYLLTSLFPSPSPTAHCRRSAHDRRDREAGRGQTARLGAAAQAVRCACVITAALINPPPQRRAGGGRARWQQARAATRTHELCLCLCVDV